MWTAMPEAGWIVLSLVAATLLIMLLRREASRVSYHVTVEAVSIESRPGGEYHLIVTSSTSGKRYHFQGSKPALQAAQAIRRGTQLIICVSKETDQRSKEEPGGIVEASAWSFDRD